MKLGFLSIEGEFVASGMHHPLAALQILAETARGTERSGDLLGRLQAKRHYGVLNGRG